MKVLTCLIILIPIKLFCIGVPDSLETIDLQHKNLSALPKDFNYSTVHTLHLGFNPLANLPQELASAKNLRLLSINNATYFNFEASLPVIKQLGLEELSINNSNLLYFPLEFGAVKSLKKLSLANNSIKEIPEYVFLHSDFHSLNFSGNQLSTIPEEIKLQQNLSFIDLSKNPCVNIASTYKNLFGLKNLQRLSVRGAKDLPADLWSLRTVEQLDISEGLFANISLPFDLKKNPLNALVSLNAADCDNFEFTELLPVLSSSPLQEITLGGQKFTGFSNASISSGVKKLTLNGLNLDHFTLANSLPNLEELNLNFNAINCQQELVNSLLKYDNLKTLNLSNCNLTRIPAQLQHLKNLATLNLSGNTLSTIDALFALKNLSVLDVSLCDLSAEEIKKLKKELPNTTILCTQSNEKLPLPNAVAPVEKFLLSPADPQKIITQNGTVISIPKNSLVYENGKAVKEDVTVNFTPFYSLAAIATSGINMNYQARDSNAAPFSSAGMFKLDATANGQNVELKKGAEIKIEFKSTDATRSYNYYAYDTLKRTWKDIGKDTLAKDKTDKQNDTTSTGNFTANSSTTHMPQPPMFYRNHEISLKWPLDKHSVRGKRFTMSAIYESAKKANDTTRNENYFNELKPLSRYHWIIDREKNEKVNHTAESKLFTNTEEYRRFKRKPRYTTAKTKTEKEVEFDLVPDKENDNFILRFYDDVDTVSYHVYPDIENRSAERAQKTIKNMFFNYDGIAQKRKEASKYRRQKFLASYNRFKINMSKIRANLSEYERRNIANLLNEKVNTDVYGITRTLQLQGFGVYNCDRPVKIENPIVIKPVFYNERGRQISGMSYQVIDPRANIIVTYYGNSSIKISKNSIITFLSTDYSKAKPVVSVGKLKTFDETQIGKTGVQLSKVSELTSIGELNAYINDTH